MTNAELQYDILDEYIDNAEVKCVDEAGNIYTIEEEDVEARDNDGNEALGGCVLFLKLKKTTAHKHPRFADEEGTKKYVIEEKHLEELIRESWKLNALDNGGVDNWEWYGEALEDYDEDEKVDFSGYKVYKEPIPVKQADWREAIRVKVIPELNKLVEENK